MIASFMIFTKNKNIVLIVVRARALQGVFQSFVQDCIYRVRARNLYENQIA